MANAKEIKRKIVSIQNTWKITKAMELISTVKMKKAQDLAIEKKDFVLEVLKIFLRLWDFFKDFPYFNKWKWNKTLAVIITSNKWLCWGYNINVLKKVSEYQNKTKEKIDFITMWKKASLFVVRTWNKLLADYSNDFWDNIEPIFVKNITGFMYEKFLSWDYKKIVIFYNYYVNSIAQIPVAREFIPLEAKEIKKYLVKVAWKHFDLEKELSGIWKWEMDYIVEPSVENIALDVVPIILDMMFHDILLEAKASEHSARMVAMKWAKDNAYKIADELTLKYNKARQSLITKEVSEIVAWVESLKDV